MSANPNKGRILVVDDDERGRSLLAGCLRAHGYDVVEACTAAECLGRLAEADCDLVLVETNIEGGRGGQLHKELQADPNRSQVSVLQITTRLNTGRSATEPGNSFDAAALLDKTAALVQSRRSDLALRQTMERFRAVFDQNPLSCFLLDREGRFLVVNRACELLLDYPARELQGVNFAKFFIPEQHESLSGAFKNTWETRASRQLAATWVRKDQQKLHIALTMSAVVVEDHVSEICCTAMLPGEPVRVLDEPQQDGMRLRALRDSLPDTAVFQYVSEADGRRRFSYCSAGVERLIGIRAEDVLRDPESVFRLIPKRALVRLRGLQEQSAVTLNHLDLEVPMQLQTGQLRWMHVHARPEVARDRGVIWEGVVTDVTDRHGAEHEREAMMEFLHLINISAGLKELVANATAFFERESGCRAVGVRLQWGDDFPYYETKGLSRAFVMAESSLCCRDPDGCIQRDHAGNPVLACMCGNVLRGRTDPARPFFTPGGSFWTNSTTDLLSGTSEQDRLTRTRNRCHGEGFESVALIPLRAADRTLGLLQLNDPRRDRFSAKRIAFLERLAGHLGVAIAKARAEQDLAKSRERMRLATIAARLFAFEWDPLTDVVRREGDSLGILGVPFSEEPATSFFSRVHPDDRDNFTKLVKSLTPLNDSYVTTYRVSRGDGGEAVLEESARACFDESGRFVRLIGMTSDITLRRHAEEAVRRRAEELERLLEVVPAAVWVANDPHCLSIYGNRRANEFYEARVGENVSASTVPEARLFFSPEGRELPASELPMQLAAATNQPVHNAELEVRLASGRKLNILGSAMPLHDELGKVRGCVAAFVDITERKQAEEALRASEQQLRVALMAGEMGTWVWEIETGMVVTDALHRTLWDIDGEEARIPAEKVLSRIHPEDVGILLSPNEAKSRSGPLRFEFRIVRNDGEVRWMRGSAMPLQDGSGKVTRLVGVNFDVTERKHAEMALKASEQEFRSVFTVSSVGKAEADPLTGRLLRVNPAYCRITGYTEQELLARTVSDITHPEDRAEHVRHYGKVASEGASYDAEKRYLRPNGEVVWVHVFANLIRDAHGKPWRTAAVVQDITARKRAEEALFESEKRLRLAQSAARMGIHDFNPLTGELHWDERVRELWGLGPDDPVTYDVFISGLHPDDRAATDQAIKHAMDPEGDGQCNVEYRLVRGDQIRWIAATGQTTFVENRAVRFTGTVHDITERKEFQAELERLVTERTAKLHDLVGELEHLSYSITHDMRAPLRAMRGFAEVVGELCSDPPQPELQRYLGRIISASERMDSLITDALSYSKAVRQELPLAPVDLHRLLQGMLDTYPEFLSHRHCITVDPGIPRVLGNEAALTQCFSNLIGNGLKFVPRGQMPEVRIRSELLSPGGSQPCVRIWVEDKGIGIPPAMLPRLFQMFSRGSGHYEGTGIGLALCRKVVQRMEGRLGVESEPGKGSRFFVDLKAADRALP